MQLYITWTSPYARIARMVIAEKGLAARVEIIEAKTRTAGSPYYAVNPSGRVPYLVTGDDLAFEDSHLIAQYLDRLDGAPRLTPPASDDGWAYGRLEAYARSFVDGLSVWVRELRRPENERSPTIIAHETARAERLADFWEREVGHRLMQGPLNLAQLYLVAGLDQAAYSRLADYTAGRPSLAAWAKRLRAIPCVASTALPERARA